MASDKQTEANRQNAQHCTGPRTEAGKATSSQNALKSGIYAKADVIRTESQSEYEELAASFRADLAPATPSEVSLVDALIRFEWLSRRYMRADAAVWERRFDTNETTHMGSIFLGNSETLERAGRLFAGARRGFAATLKQLRAEQAQRAAATASQNAETEPPSPEMVSFPQDNPNAAQEPFPQDDNQPIAA